MPVFRNSRFSFTDPVVDRDCLTLTDRVPVTYRDDSGNFGHVVQQGDTPWGLAWKYFQNVAVNFPSMLYWIILEYQPDPIADPTVALESGRLLIIPSERVVAEEILARRPRG